VQRVALRGEKPQNWPLSKLNTGRFALRAMLPVKIYSKLNNNGTSRLSGAAMRMDYE